jgi:hypothetical protein
MAFSDGTFQPFISAEIITSPIPPRPSRLRIRMTEVLHGFQQDRRLVDRRRGARAPGFRRGMLAECWRRMAAT